MRYALSSFLLAACLAAPALAQSPAEITAERTRIGAERQRVEAEFGVSQKACYGKFGVNGCLDEARGRRREALADLRRQEVGLNDMERKRRAAERLRELDQRQSEQQEQRRSDARTKAQADDQARQERNTQKAAKAERAPRAKAPPAAKAPKQPDVEDNLRRSAQRASEAQEHKARVEERAARKRKQAAPLPAPQE